MSAAADLRARMLEATPEQRAEMIHALTPAQQHTLLYSWDFWGRAEQQWRPGPERDTWYFCGRGWGKTVTGGYAVRYLVEHPEECGGDIAIVGRTASMRNREMVPAILAAWPPELRPIHKTRKNVEEIRFPACKDIVGRLMSGDSPDTIRGNNLGAAWTDEPAHWPKLVESWSNLEMALRKGRKPRTVNTSTPLGRLDFLRLMFEFDTSDKPVVDPSHPTGLRPLPHVRVVTGSSYANAANLSPDWIASTLSRKEGTRLGQQEIHGLVLLDVAHALWRWSDFRHGEASPKHDRRIVAIDPSGGTSNAGNAETGMIVAGMVGQRIELLQDASGHHDPEAWGLAAIDLYDELGCEAIVAETNYGADMVRATIELVSRLPEVARSRRARGTERPIRIEEVNASSAWHERAGYVQPLWRSGLVLHAGDPRTWLDLEHQMRHGDPSRPKRGQRLDRLDAAVHAVTYLTTQRTVSLPALTGTAVDDFWGAVARGLR